MNQLISRLAKEPLFRVFVQKILKIASRSVRTRALWDVSPRPHYLVGVLQAADEAKRWGIDEIAVAEFGVAGGNGLVELQICAEEVENATGIRITVYGFDSGAGLPELCGDHRDHPDHWAPSDYVMDLERLKSRLTARTRLILGNVKETVSQYVSEQTLPLGFAAMDLDLYSSTRDALSILTLPGKRILPRTYLYFDDIDLYYNHKYAGELLAIDEFNLDRTGVRIDKWRGIAHKRPFFEDRWLQRMYIAHDLETISHYKRTGPARNLDLR